MANREEVGDPAPVFHVNGRPYEGISGATMTPAEILAYAGLDADDYVVFAEGHRGRRLPAEEPVPVVDGARFVAVPRDEA